MERSETRRGQEALCSRCRQKEAGECSGIRQRQLAGHDGYHLGNRDLQLLRSETVLGGSRVGKNVAEWRWRAVTPRLYYGVCPFAACVFASRSSEISAAEVGPSCRNLGTRSSTR